jgi:hypothetical protein
MPRLQATPSSAGLFYCTLGPSRRARVTYSRFGSLGPAVRCAMEEVSDNAQPLTIEWNDREFEGDEILALYTSTSYPLVRRQRRKKAILPSDHQTTRNSRPIWSSMF